MNTRETEVAIVGAGPAGALLACLLARQGVSVTLVEKNGDLDREFRGEHLHEDSVRLLQRQGLWAAVEQAGILPMRAVEMMQGRKPVLRVTPELFGIDQVGIHVPQAHLLRPMVQEAQRQPDFHLLLGASVTELLRDEAGQVVGVAVNGGAGTLSIRARVVVGADGRFSAVRKHSGIPTAFWKHGYDLLWAKVPAPTGWPDAMRFGFLGEHGFALFSAYPHAVQLGWRIPEGGFKQVRSRPVADFTDVICQAAPELAPAVKERLRNWSDFHVLSVQSCMAERWSADGLLLIGDAAHTMSPAGGIGVNTALCDAEVAAEVIAAALLRGDVSAAALGEVERRRRPAVQKQQATQKRQEEQNLRVTTGRLMRWFYYLSLHLLERSPFKRQFFAKMYVVNN